MGKVTLKDLAKELGVSTTLVSRVLNAPRREDGTPDCDISKDTAMKVLELAQRLNYKPSRIAAGLRSGKRYLLGVITPDISNYAFSEAGRYIEELAIKCTGSKQKARELSGGNQQKICLAKAFALEPKFLFVSEPTRGIDIGAKELVLQALKKFNRESGVTVVMISSELEELRQICDRIAIVSGGRIAGIRPASDPSEEFGLLMVSMVK